MWIKTNTGLGANSLLLIRIDQLQLKKEDHFVLTGNLAPDLYLLGIRLTLKAYFAIRQTPDILMWIQSWLSTLLSNAMTM